MSEEIQAQVQMLEARVTLLALTLKGVVRVLKDSDLDVSAMDDCAKEIEELLLGRLAEQGDAQ